MGIKELKERVTYQVAHTNNGVLLELLADLLDEAAQEAVSHQEKEALLAAALEGRAEIDAGHFGTLTDLATAMKTGMEQGLARREARGNA
jgi:hypothetical protein